jgi:hypothetical protein
VVILVNGVEFSAGQTDTCGCYDVDVAEEWVTDILWEGGEA